MSDRRQVLQEAEKALEPFVRLAELKDRNDFVPEPDGNAWTFGIYGGLTVGDLRRARSVLALIRASLAEADPPETAVTEAGATEEGVEAAGRAVYFADHSYGGNKGKSLADIDAMVNRFLSWRLPENFQPDGGISFKKFANEGTEYQHKYEPTGTNLFDVTQARQMIEYMLNGGKNV